MDIRDIADFFYESCCLGDDPSIDPCNHLAVIDAAFLSSDCDDFAWVLSKITGWPARTLLWDLGNGVTGHHAVVEAPDGRYLDVTGWTDCAASAARSGIEDRLVSVHEFRHHPFNFSEFADDEGIEVLLGVFDAVARDPFTQPWFQTALADYRSGLPSEDPPLPFGIAP
jgi:hypothetical protein